MTENRFENLIWISIGSLFLYIGDGKRNFIEILQYDERVKRDWLGISIALVIANALIFLYLFYGVKCWTSDRRVEESAPWLTNFGGLLLIISGICFIIGMWNVFWYFALVNLPMIFISFLFLIDLVPARKTGELEGNLCRKCE